MNDGQSSAAALENLNISQNALKAFISNSNDVVELKLVRKAEEIVDDETTFNPDMTHQVFGENEVIFGYRDLQIKLYCTAAKLTTYLSINYSDKVNPSKFEGVEADDIEKALAERLAPGYLTNIDSFTAELQKERKYKPHGKQLHSFTTDGRSDDPIIRKYEIYTCDIMAPGFKDFHERLQPFLLFFVDASSYIDVDDDRWRFFTVWEKYVDDSGDNMYAIAGYSTVYQYYAYPEHIRPRISQMLVLPTFQRQGVGSELLEAIYKYYIPQNKVIDITVEDPSDDFMRLRDFIDVRRCRSLDAFQPEKLCKGFSDSMVEEAKRCFKMPTRQIRKVYEILRLSATDKSNAAEYRAYRLEVKNRLNLPFQKNKRDFTKLKKQLKSDELEAVMGLSSEQRLETLQKMYEEVEDAYYHVLERISAA